MVRRWIANTCIYTDSATFHRSINLPCTRLSIHLTTVSGSVSSGRGTRYFRLATVIATICAATTSARADVGGFEDLPKPVLACGTPQVGFFDEFITVIGPNTDARGEALAGDAVYFRRGGGPWEKTQQVFNGAHALTRMPTGKWLIADTGNNRLVQMDDISGAGHIAFRSTLAGFKLNRPHYALALPVEGYVYVIDGKRRLFRFRDLEQRAQVWTFTAKQLGYARSLSWFDGHVHIIVSGRGQVLRIESFEKHRYTVFRSPRPVITPLPIFAIYNSPYMDFGAGALTSTGLVLNGVEKVGDWYYGSNNFIVQYSLGDDTRPARLIRWRNWVDFQRGKWQDLSGYLPASDIPPVPYFLSVHKGSLYAGVNSRKINAEGCSFGGVFHLELAVLENDRNQ